MAVAVIIIVLESGERVHGHGGVNGKGEAGNEEEDTEYRHGLGQLRMGLGTGWGCRKGYAHGHREGTWMRMG